jgi:hypothetical protein
VAVRMVISPRFRGVVVVRSIVALAIDFEDAIDRFPILSRLIERAAEKLPLHNPNDIRE